MADDSKNDVDKVALTVDEKGDMDESVLAGDGDFDSSKVKFINGGANEAVLDIEEEKRPQEFVGLTKEELKKYANDPYWVRVRWILFIGFWVIWIAMLVAAIMIIVFAPRCPPVPKLEWHQKEASYSINVKSFRDSDGDGVGDFNGVKEKLGYLMDSKMKVIRFNNIFEGSDTTEIADLKAVNPMLGTKDDLQHLLTGMLKKDMKVILELNLRNKKVKEEIEDALKYWMDMGVSGFFIKDAGEGVFTNETYAMVTEWRDLIDGYGSSSTKKRYLGVEAEGTAEQLSGFLMFNGSEGAHQIERNNLMEVKADSNGQDVSGIVGDLSAIDKPWQTIWKLSSDKGRFATGLGDRIKSVVMLQMTLPGLPAVLYGDEIGMTGDADGIMQWTAGPVAGFSDNGTAWKNVGGNYKTKNVQLELAHGSLNNNLEVFRELAELRGENSFLWGMYKEIDTGNPDLFAFTRRAEGFPGFLIVINFSEDPIVAELHAASASSEHPIPHMAVVVASTDNNAHHAEAFDLGTEVKLDNVYLQGNEGVVFRWEWSDGPF